MDIFEGYCLIYHTSHVYSSLQFYFYERKDEWSLTVFTTWTFMALSIQAKSFLIFGSKFGESNGGGLSVLLQSILCWWLPKYLSNITLYYPTCSSISCKNQNSPYNFTPEIVSLLVITESLEIFFNLFLLCFLYPNCHKRH